MEVGHGEGGSGTYCKPCRRRFPDWETLMKHKFSMRQHGKPHHIHCRFCGHDFMTRRAEWLHIQQNHPEKQNLKCPGCGQGPFERVGALIAHIEYGWCKMLTTRDIEEVREQKLEFPRQLEAWTGETVKNNYARYFASSTPGLSRGFKHRLLEDGTPAEKYMLKDNDFPQLVTEWKDDEPAAKGEEVTAVAKVENKVNQPENVAWGRNVNLFPDAPPAQRPTAEQLQVARAPSEQAVARAADPDHPSHPNFNIARYKCEYTGKYKCPNKVCTKEFKKAGGLYAHLRGPAHTGNTYQCPTCYRHFESLTAITQHSEAYGTRCTIRDSTNYDAYLDQLTAGIVSTDLNRFADGTIKYNTGDADGFY